MSGRVGGGRRGAHVPIDAAIPDVNFRASTDFALGIEEELLLVDPVTHALEHSAVEVLERFPALPPRGAVACGETYSALVELVSPVCADVEEAVASLAAARQRLRGAGATAIGAGLHPAGEFGDVVHFPSRRYRLIADEMRGLLSRTPTCAVHIHVGMPDAEAAVRAFNGLRSHLPLLQALSANSPFWHGLDSGLASARAQVFRAFPTAEIPATFASFDEYAGHVARLVAASGLPDYTFLWWDIRLQPVLGTVEVRMMDSQSSLDEVAGLAALVHALARHAVEDQGSSDDRDVLMESSFRAARDGLEATLWYEGALRPVPEIAQETIQLARPYARELGCEAELEAVERMLADGNGAIRQRAAFERDGLAGVLDELVEETARTGHQAVGLGAIGEHI
jgi:glutamate---cysteine ligase / carboxylate-amine ligase